MHAHRVWFASLAGAGLVTFLLPWITVMGLFSVKGYEVGQGWVVPLLFAAALAITLFAGPRSQPLEHGPRGVVIVLGGAATIFGVYKLLEIRRGAAEVSGQVGEQLASGDDLGRGLAKGMFGSLGDPMAVGFGIYAVVVVGAALAITALVLRKR